MLHIETIIFTSAVINILAVVIFKNHFTNHLILESLLGGTIMSLIINIYKKSKTLKMMELDNNNTIKNLKRTHRYEMSAKQNELEVLQKYIEDADSENVILRETIVDYKFGDIYYITENGGKLHKIKNCDSIKDRNVSIVTIHPTLISVLNNADKMCKLCTLNSTHYFGVEIYYTPSGSRIYTSKETLSPQHRDTATSSIISKNEFNMLKMKFPEIIKESI